MIYVNKPEEIVVEGCGHTLAVWELEKSDG